MYSTGQGVPQDFKKDKYWFKKAIEQWYEKAQSNLNMLSDGGHHAIKDMVHGVEIEKPKN